MDQTPQPESHFVDFEPEPVKSLPYNGPPTARTLVPGKPDNRRHRRAERAFNKKAVALAKKIAQANTRAKKTPDPLLPMTEESASPSTSFVPELP